VHTLNISWAEAEITALIEAIFGTINYLSKINIEQICQIWLRLELFRVNVKYTGTVLRFSAFILFVLFLHLAYTDRNNFRIKFWRLNFVVILSYCIQK
jgi:hypothetical protein